MGIVHDSTSETQQNSLAPSEKHLENWIVNNFKQFGETFNADEVYSDYAPMYHWIDDDHYIEPFFGTLVARQYRLPSGIPDLITYRGESITAVEIKKGLITYDVIGQCLRYMHDLSEIFCYVNMEVLTSEQAELHRYRHRRKLEIDEYPSSEVTGMVVGHGTQDKNIVMVAAACNIRVVTYQMIDERYSFTHELLDRPHPNLYKAEVDTQIGLYMRSLMTVRVARDKFVELLNHDR